MTVHHVFANRTNIGDRLSALGIQRLLAVPVEEHLCDAPFIDATLAALAEAPEEDVLVIGGGGLFMDYFDSFWDGFLAVVAPRLRYCVWGAGFVDLKREPSRSSQSLSAEVARQAELCVVRDALSRDHLANPELPAPSPCPSMAVIDAEPPGWGVCHVDNFTTVGEREFEAMDAQCRDYASNTGRPYCRTNNLVGFAGDKTVDEVLARYRASDVIVTSRLHGCIIGVGMGRRVVAVSGDRKIESFMKDAGLGEWVLPQERVGKLAETLGRIDDQRSAHAFRERAHERLRMTAVAVRKTLALDASTGTTA